MTILLLTSCSGELEGAQDSAPAAAAETATDGTGLTVQVPTGTEPVRDWEPDYDNDAGEDLEEFDYPDDPEPAESIVGTLCNLTQRHFEGLRATSGGRPVVDDNLRTMLVGLSDLLGSWDTLRSHYPESVPHIDTARQIYELWDEAVLNVDNQDADAAQDAMIEAERLLEVLPDAAPDDCVS